MRFFMPSYDWGSWDLQREDLVRMAKLKAEVPTKPTSLLPWPLWFHHLHCGFSKSQFLNSLLSCSRCSSQKTPLQTLLFLPLGLIFLVARVSLFGVIPDFQQLSLLPRLCPQKPRPCPAEPLMLGPYKGAADACRSAS